MIARTWCVPKPRSATQAAPVQERRFARVPAWSGPPEEPSAVTASVNGKPVERTAQVLAESLATIPLESPTTRSPPWNVPAVTMPAPGEVTAVQAPEAKRESPIPPA